MIRLGYRARLAAWHAAVLAVILGVSVTALDWTVRRIVLDQFDATLLHAAQSVAAEIAEEGPASPGPVLPVKRVRRLLWSFQPIIEVVDPADAVITLIGAQDPLPITPSVREKARRGKVMFQTRAIANVRALRVVVLRAPHGTQVYAVEVAHSLDDLHVLLFRIRWLILGTAVAILVAIVATDVVLTGRVLRPIDAIVRQARQLSESNLAERLPQPTEPGEIARLVETLNEMLLRLHTSFQAQHRFAADAAHELRSPLTRLRTEMEVSLRRPRDVEEYRLIVVNALDEIERLGGLTENLLALARLDAGEGRQAAAGEARLADVIDTVVTRFQSTAIGRGVALRAEHRAADIRVRVLPAIVDVVLGNVVDNAVKFSAPGGAVTLDVMATQTEGIVTVSDTGPGIPGEEQPHVFDRFFRGRAARASGTLGVGLGLAIARTLVERQNGLIELDSKPGSGTTVTIRLPLA